MNIHSPLPNTAAAQAGRRSDGISRSLCQMVSAWRFEDIPADVLSHLKLLTVDAFGVIAGAAQAPGIAEVNARFGRWERDGSATSLLTGRRLSPPSAALANGAAAHALDFDDIHDPARIHAFAVLLPVMLATAEDMGGVDGRRFLRALAVAAETDARLGFACYNSLGKGWHPTMVFGTLAGAIGAGLLVGLDSDGLLNALGIAYHQTCGTAQSMHDGALTKRLGPGFAARNAVTAAFLAADGITGPSRPLEGAAGLFSLFERGEVRPEELFQDAGDAWRTRDYSLKPYPCCRCNHTTIDLALDLRMEGLRPDDVEAAEIRLPQVNFQTVGEGYHPERDSVVHAQFNAGYSFARALTDGLVDLSSYTRPAITDEAVVRLTRRITAVSNPGEDGTAMGPARVIVRLRDGGTREARAADTRPMQPDDVLAKFRRCMAYGLEVTEADASRFADRLMHIDELDDVSCLVRQFPKRA